MRWEMGLSTGIAYHHPIQVVLEPIRRTRFRTIEVATAPNHLDVRGEGSFNAVAHQIADLGLSVHSLHAPFGHDMDLTDPDPGFRQSSLETLRRAADALAVLGGKLYVIHPGGEDHHWVWDRDDRLQRSAEGLNQVWEMCRERGLTLTVETPLPHLLGGQLGDLSWLLERLPTEGTGVCVDTSHCSLGGFLYEAIERFKHRLIHIQASDNRGVTDDHLPPGEGVIDWVRFLSELERVDYKGVFMLEVTGNGDIDEHLAWVAERSEATLPALWKGH